MLAITNPMPTHPESNAQAPTIQPIATTQLQNSVAGIIHIICCPLFENGIHASTTTCIVPSTRQEILLSHGRLRTPLGAGTTFLVPILGNYLLDSRLILLHSSRTATGKSGWNSARLQSYTLLRGPYIMPSVAMPTSTIIIMILRALPRMRLNSLFILCG